MVRFYNNGYRQHIVVVCDHTTIAERKYGMKKPDNFVVHHIDGDKLNNAPGNLIWLHKKDHALIHYYKKLKVERI